MNVVCPRCGISLGLVEPLDSDATIQRACQDCWPHLTGRPTRFVYVSQGQVKLFRELVDEYRGDPTVLVLLDRRVRDRRRRTDRRKDRRPGSAVRRGTGTDRRKLQVGIVVRGRRDS